MLPAPSSPTVSRPSDAQPGGEGARARVARVTGPRQSRVRGPLAGAGQRARDDFAARYARELPAAVQCFGEDFAACTAHLRFPIGHRKVIRTTNLLERLFGEERRRMKV